MCRNDHVFLNRGEHSSGHEKPGIWRLDNLVLILLCVHFPPLHSCLSADVGRFLLLLLLTGCVIVVIQPWNSFSLQWNIGPVIYLLFLSSGTSGQWYIWVAIPTCHFSAGPNVLAFHRRPDEPMTVLEASCCLYGTQQQEEVFHWLSGCQLERRLLQMSLSCQDGDEAWGWGRYLSIGASLW